MIEEFDDYIDSNEHFEAENYYEDSMQGYYGKLLYNDNGLKINVVPKSATMYFLSNKYNVCYYYALNNEKLFITTNLKACVEVNPEYTLNIKFEYIDHGSAEHFNNLIDKFLKLKVFV